MDHKKRHGQKQSAGNVPVFETAARALIPESAVHPKYPLATETLERAYTSMFAMLYVKQHAPQLLERLESVVRTDNRETWDPFTIHLEHGRDEGMRRAIELFMDDINLAIAWQLERSVPGDKDQLNLAQIERSFDNGNASIAFDTPAQAVSLLRAMNKRFPNIRDDRDTFVSARRMDPDCEVNQQDIALFSKDFSACAAKGKKIFSEQPDSFLSFMPMRPYNSLDEACGFTLMSGAGLAHHNWHFLSIDNIENQIAQDMGQAMPHPAVMCH